MGLAARRWVRFLGLATIAVLLWGGWRIGRIQADRKAMAAIRDDIRDGRHATAASKLEAYMAADPASDEALYLLGSCEMALGRAPAADAAWSRVSPDSRFAARAILGRMQIQLARGRPAEAETLIRDALNDPRIDGAGLPILLGPILCQQGRLDEALQIIESRWSRLEETGEGASEPAIELIRLYTELRRQPIPIDGVRSVLDQAASLAPDDDRVWLGRANLAIRTGDLDEAARWINACLRRRPDDVPAWRARLDWAVASGRVPEAMDALKHLPAAGEPPSRIPRLAAWLAARRGDETAEAHALERVTTIEPTDFAAVDRLAAIDTRQGRSADLAALQARRAETERLLARFETLRRRNQPRRDAAEMSRLAERLGYPFEAMAFAAIDAAANPDDAEPRHRLASLRAARSKAGESGPTLADALNAASPPPTADQDASSRSR